MSKKQKMRQATTTQGTVSISHKMFLQILTEAEERVKEYPPDTEAHKNSQETVDLCLERMRREGLTREELKRKAALDKF